MTKDRRFARCYRKGVLGRSTRRAVFFRPFCELLEDRRMLAVAVWDGEGANNLWTTPANWSDDIAPIAGDELVFPVSVPSDCERE